MVVRGVVIPGGDGLMMGGWKWRNLDCDCAVVQWGLVLLLLVLFVSVASPSSPTIRGYYHVYRVMGRSSSSSRQILHCHFDSDDVVHEYAEEISETYQYFNTQRI